MSVAVRLCPFEPDKAEFSLLIFLFFVYGLYPSGFYATSPKLGEEFDYARR